MRKAGNSVPVDLQEQAKKVINERHETQKRYVERKKARGYNKVVSWMPTYLYEKLCEVAEAEGRTRSVLLCQYVEQGLANRQKILDRRRK